MFKDRIKIRARKLYIGGKCSPDGVPDRDPKRFTTFLAVDNLAAIRELGQWVALRYGVRVSPMRCTVIRERNTEVFFKIFDGNDVLIGHFLLRSA